MIVGIDLGTSTSEVAILRNGKPMLIREVRGAPHGILPSVIGIETSGELCVGQLAEGLLIPKPDRAVAEVKRKMGTEERITLGSEEFTPQEISARILRHLKDEAEKYLGEPVREAVITVPAYFNDRQRRATQDAAEIAGLKLRRLINEPTAAALAYGIERPGVEEKVLVYDLGGGTLDVTVLELSEGYLDVMASTGNSRLGGKDFDERLMRLLHQECLRATGIDLVSTPRLRQRLKAEAKKAKEALSSADSVRIVLDNIGMGPDGDPIDYERTVTRAEFEALIRALVESTRAQMTEALEAKAVRPQEIDTVLMIGGSTRIPLVRQFVSDFFGGRTLRTEVSPDEAVALGAAVLSGIEARVIDPEDLVITDVSPHTFGVEVVTEIDGRMVPGVFSPIVQKNTTIPCTKAEHYRTMIDLQQQIHVRVYQGDAFLCEQNVMVGEFPHRIPNPGPAGQEIEIEMSYNLNGTIDVAARDPRTGKETRVMMAPDGITMSEGERARAKQRLERHATAQGPAATAAPAPAPSGPDAAPAIDWRSSPFYGRVAALIDHTEKRLSAAAGQGRVPVERLLNELKAALAGRDEARVDQKEKELLDLLFEMD